ncbi:hypothetical protein DSECCO2_303300 [anaerobic digester metagenome]
MKNQASTPTLDLSKSKPLEAKSTNRGGISISVVNTAGNGKRIKLSKDFMEKLGNPSAIQLRILDEKIILSSHFSDNDKSFKFSKANTGIIYNSAVVASFTKVLNLDFSSVTSVTLSNIQFTEATAESGKAILVAIVSCNL